MKVRIGVGIGPTERAADFAAVVDHLEALGADSIWLPERVFSPTVDPMVGLGFAASRTQHLKLGTGVTVLPGRDPVLVAKQIATLAALAPGRALPAVGLRPAEAAERVLFPVPDGQRAAVFDESLEVLRGVLTGQPFTHHGRYFELEQVSVGFVPEEPIDLWLGGQAPAALRRVGRLGDGWLASFLTPDEAAAGRVAIQHAAAEAGREIDPEHFGVNLSVAVDDVPDSVLDAVRARRPQLDPHELVATGWSQAKRRIDEFTTAGISKFVVRPVGLAPPWRDFLDQFAAELMPLQT